MAQNALWREDFGKKHVYILVTKIYYWNIQKTMKRSPKSWHKMFHSLMMNIM